MKTQKLNVLDFKENELSRKDISSIKAGESIKPKPTSTVSGNGSGGDEGATICFYNFDGELLYCRPGNEGEDSPITSSNI